jgi:hypothetical protein
MRDLCRLLSEDEWAEIFSRRIRVSVLSGDRGRVMLRHPNGCIGSGSSVGQALDNLREQAA